jgi:hypothetical protein
MGCRSLTGIFFKEKIMSAQIRSGLVKARKIATVAVPAALVANGAHAEGVDVSGVVTAINGAAAPIASIGAAVLLVMVGIKVYKWVRKAM